ncbi:flagellar basal body P-ring formation chaperone FlgA [Rhodanobacter geophilus]|uniref:Flagella basal body P-ring formation protein FlgA n=1 Tax=Rhodanobacter geophilus TaxID=3162488 RepID=A0ABV3QTP1_9GAMM
MSGHRASAGRLLVLAWLGLPGISLAAVPSPDTVRAVAEQAVRAHFELPGGRVVALAVPLDPRVRLASCSVPLRATLADAVRAAPRLSVPVHCPQAEGWTVRVQVQLQLFRPVLVTNRALLRGDGLRPEDVHAEERDVTRLGYGYVGNLDQVAGRTLARALPSGSVLTPSALGGRRMVRAGDHVQVVASLDGIVVRTDGVALGSGDNGARLRVRNESSGKVVDAMVHAPGVVLALP